LGAILIQEIHRRRKEEEGGYVVLLFYYIIGKAAKFKGV